MINIFYIFLGISMLFFFLLIIKGLIKKFKEKFCVICTTISIVWIFLLILYWLNLFENKTIIALLMGQTILGFYYIVENKTKKELHIFRLPFLLTLILVGYSLLAIPNSVIKSIILLSILWTIFALLYIYRNNQNVKSLIKKIIDCCKKW